ncbi:MAG TPA: metallophosphoesterase [Ruminococcus sp.]|nr:metallophosphoesterase [Ruminococcus sp.]HCR73924.1 metallophosphoesterase [Ruminococcus sp.]
MRIIVMSDSHGNYYPVKEIMQRNLAADMFIHLGDGEREFDEAAKELSLCNTYHVKGNCDFGSMSPDMLCINLEYGHRLIAAHGHNQYVNFTLDNLKKAAAENNADIILYGHTHERFCKYEDGLYIMNPGSASCPRDGLDASYGYIDVTEKGILANVLSIRR